MFRLAACWSPVCLSVGVITLGFLFGGCEVVGQSESDTVAKNLNVPLPTIGGAQLWTDLENRSGYRLQRNALSGHCRVLDPSNIRRGWGTETEAMELLDNLCADVPEPSAKPTVVLIHGLMRTDSSMKSLEKALRADGYDQVIRFGYASTRSGLAESAAALRRVLEGQHPETEFCFVGHSMGNIVTRHLIGDLQRDGDPANLLPRCRAMVMVGAAQSRRRDRETARGDRDFWFGRRSRRDGARNRMGGRRVETRDAAVSFRDRCRQSWSPGRFAIRSSRETVTSSLGSRKRSSMVPWRRTRCRCCTRS
ncbi:esterase/lipase family protein [Rhodopirellula sallentina]|uniref:Lipase n=1 Tax=Rhodopirellula sallentina SM41 TaxID=1263870 RepID=M5UC88_9BACT|nr:lipase [Rhodopirellula sallentina]EMI53613.1 lipase [Rhodopirellula sallentina SM41]